MTVAFGNFLESLRTATTDPWTTGTLADAGSRKGAGIFIHNNNATTDLVSTVTFGGASLNEIVQINTSGAAVNRNNQLWYLGTSVPSGTQSFTIDLTSASGNDMWFFGFEIQAAADTEVVTYSATNGSGADPSATLTVGGRTCATLGMIAHDADDVGSLTINGNMTAVHDNDFGTRIVRGDRMTSVSSSDPTFSYTATADFWAMIVAAISEVQAQKKMRWTIGGMGGKGGANERPGIIG